jgi:hypothetical protein
MSGFFTPACHAGTRVTTLVVCLVALTTVIISPSTATAQAARDARVQVTVVDPSGLVVPEATVTLVGLEPATQATTLPDGRTTDKGLAIIERVPPGRYSIRAEFPGFDLGLLRDVRVRAGESRHVVILPLQKLEDAVTVSRSAQETAADRRSSDFGLKLSNEQIEALSDDPNELARQLAELSGPDAIIRVDSFEGQQLPPKAQIKSIHVTRDQFAAEAAQPGSTFVDIVTQPGIGALRGATNVSLRDGSLTGRSQFTPTRGPEQFRDFGGNIGGTIVPNKTSFSASLNGQSNYQSPILNVKTPDGTRAETLNVRQPLRNATFNGIVDHALTRDQTLKVSLMVRRFKRENAGIGNYNLPERGFWQEQKENSIRIQEAGPLGRRSFINTRFSYTFGDIAMASNVEAPTLVVQDSFTSGGAQQRQFADLRFLSLASDVDHVRGIHSFRGGFQVDANWFDAASSFNYLGTYTFASLDDFERGRPILYTRSLGTPQVTYNNFQGALYFQDDIRVRRGLTFSPGVRYTRQQRVNDPWALEPRFGFTWSPLADGRTTLRGSAGTFHSWLPLQLVEQTLRLNGELQREIIIQNPSYPEPGEETVLALPTSKYLIGDGFKLGRNVRYSAGLDQVLSPRVRTNILYNYIHLQQQPRGRNLNAPVNGVRPDPDFANVIESITDTEVRRHEIYVNAIISLAAPSPALNQAWFNWRRLNINAGYSWIRAQNNAAGPFDVSPSGDPANDWGPGPQDTPYRIQILMTSTQIKNVTANLTYTANSGAPYNWTTGFDDNRDGLLNDRPAGVGLRSLRGDEQQTLNARIQYAFALTNPQGLPIGQARYRMNLFANINNVTNHQNLGGYSCVATSPYFRQPTFAMNPRNVNIGVGFNF